MKTAEEKREVAENLREQAAYPGSSSMYMEAFIEDLKQIIDPCRMSNSYADLYDILADLIEPSETKRWMASQGLTKEQLEFDWWLSGRVMHELGFDGDTADRDEVESRFLARLMPEGMEWLLEVWPKWSNGEYCKFGDWWKADNYGESKPNQFRKLSIYTPEQLDEWGQGDGESYGYEWDFVRPADPKYRPDKVEPPAPKVLDADGEEICVGDECYVTSNGDGPYVVYHIREADGAIDMHWHKNKNESLHIRPDLITHRAPVLASDGRPLREGETVGGTKGGSYHITSVHDGEVFAHHVGGSFGAEVESAGGEGLYRLRAEQLTHERPDSWERLEDDARQLDIDLNDTTDDYPRMSCCRDLVRRAKELAERGE